MTPFEHYKALLEILIIFKQTNVKMLESEESDVIRDRMDPLWNKLTEREIQAIEEWAENYKINSDKKE